MYCIICTQNSLTNVESSFPVKVSSIDGDYHVDVTGCENAGGRGTSASSRQKSTTIRKDKIAELFFKNDCNYMKM